MQNHEKEGTPAKQRPLVFGTEANSDNHPANPYSIHHATVDCNRSWICIAEENIDGHLLTYTFRLHGDGYPFSVPGGGLGYELGQGYCLCKVSKALPTCHELWSLIKDCESNC